MVETLFSVRNLKKHFDLKGGQILKAVDGVSFDIERGETVGLVGESGCGKSTTGRTLIGLYQATSGEIVYKGKNVQRFQKHEQMSFYRSVQMVFQDPYASLNPRMTVFQVISEGMDIQRIGDRKKRKEVVCDSLEQVGLRPEHADRFPHEFSGGQRQRIGIARALVMDPEFIICDEPISALDVSIQAQVVNMLQDFQRTKGLTYLFIAHDLSMVKHISSRIGVMYLGKLMEVAPSVALYEKPMHPYTQALLSAVPIPDPDEQRSRKRILLEGDLPSPVNPPSGCTFRTRCPQVSEDCARVDPQFKEIEPGHFVSCHLYG
ncbi:MAG: ATP-binding cassette domain-containing protein [Thaumarchaeota archaeon]|nr:ATP-binding cassette domain-containing protein [Nitrososphaerota archaeon]